MNPDQTDVVSSLNTLLRFLVAYSPIRAEILWSDHRAYPEMPRGHWIELPDTVPKYVRGWICHGENGLVERSQTPPVGVNQADILKADRPPNVNPSLGDAYHILLHRLVVTADRKKYEWNYSMLAEHHDGRFEKQEMAIFLNQCIASLVQGINQTDVVAPLREYCREYTAGLSERFKKFEVPGFYVGWCQLLDRAWRGVEFIPLLAIKVGQEKFADFPDFINFVFGGIVKNDGPDRLTQAATNLFDDAKRAIASAVDEDDEARFYDKLFSAVPMLVAAEYGYDYWGNYPGQRSQAKDQSRIAGEQAHAWLERILASLMIAFENSATDHGAFRLHRSHVERTIKKFGPKRADEVVDDYLESRLLYPKLYRSRFLSVDRSSFVLPR
jgi:hypothetical protein